MSEGRLRVRVAAYAREEAWAPRYVADELEATHEVLRRRQTDATVWAARAEVEPDPLARDQLSAAAQQARKEAAQLARQVDELETVDNARALWWIETAVTRDKAERARVVLGMRGIDLDNPTERVTAREWLDAHEAEKLAADANRVITEHDLHPASRPDVHEPAEERATQRQHYSDRTDTDEPARHDLDIQPATPDIRDTSTRDAGERADPEQRRRVPRPDETAASVARAQLARVEIAARRAAEATEQARAAEVEPDADDRRQELARWADHDNADGTAVGDHRAELDGPGLGRDDS